MKQKHKNPENIDKNAIYSGKYEIFYYIHGFKNKSE